MISIAPPSELLSYVRMKELRTAMISVRVKPSVKEGIERLARAEKRPVASYVEIVLEQHVEASIVKSPKLK